MKKLTFLLISVLLQAEGYVIQVPTATTVTRTTPVGWVHIQKLLLPLFENVCEESTDPIVVRLNEEFKLDPSFGLYLKSDVIDNLQALRTKGMLAKGVIFTEYDTDHLNELKVIYDLLYYAKDFDTFYKAASWARQNVNCGLFVDAIYLAILNRRDTERITIPAPYELLPNYFIRKDFIIKASSLIRGETFLLPEWVRNEGNAYILDVNYTTNYYDESDDKLAYFHEDVGLNSYYYLNRLKKLPWITDLRNLQGNNCGEHIYHSMKQMMARYNLERYSNGLMELEGIDWDYINGYSYDPMLIYSNGNEFSQRTGSNDNNEILMLLKNIENSLPAVVVHMRDGGYNKSEIINHLMEILVTGEKSYENLALQYLGAEKLISSGPSVLEHYMTTIRDPIFWKLNKKIVDIIDKALEVLPSYTRSQLYFPGVVVQNIEAKKIMSSFDNFEFDVTNALKSEGEDVKFQVKINQPRLNHKPFNFKITISSLVAQKSLIKLYLGPKVMPGELVEKKNMFMLLDCFEYNLKIGSNVVTRTTNDMLTLSDDFTSLETLHKKVLDAEFGLDTLLLKPVWSQIGFPSRLILPKGTSEGLPLHLFVFVAPYVKATLGGPTNTLDLNLDAILSPGYPLDLSVEMQQLFNLPNALVKDVIITHKTESSSNKPINTFNSGINDNIWQSSDVEYISANRPLALSVRPAFNKKTFDYKSKKNQYTKKYDYASKKDEINQDTKTIGIPTEDEVPTKLNNDNKPDNMEVINNIYITPEFERDISHDNIMDKNNIHYRFSPDNIYDKSNAYFTPSDNIDTSNFNYMGTEYNVKPHGVLKMPKEKFSNIFNIVFKPVKPDEEVYE